MASPHKIYLSVICVSCKKPFLKRKDKSGYRRRTGIVRGANTITCSHKCSVDHTRSRYRKI